MTDLPTGGSPITVDLGYDIKHSGRHAVDYLTHFDRLEPHQLTFGHDAESVSPTSGVSGLSNTLTTFQIPAPSSAGSPVAGQPTDSYNDLVAAEGAAAANMTMFGGTINDIQYVSQGSLTAAQAETIIRVTFTPDSATAVLAWGGHIGSRLDWGFDANGVALSAGGISGSPYHMRLIDWSQGNIGQQDRSLSAGAVVEPPPQDDLDVNKDAVATFTRTFEWDIDKSVTPDTLDLFTGDSGTADYTVTVTNTGSTDSAWAVSGTITIENPDSNIEDASITGVTDMIQPDGITADVECGVVFPHDLAPGDTLVCTYSADLPDGGDRTNTVTVDTDGEVGGGGDQAEFGFVDPTTLADESVSVSDDVQGPLGSCDTATAPCDFTYDRTFTCDEDAGDNPNTASFVTNDTGATGEDSASVTVNCFGLDVTKDANTSLTRTWVWDIDKSADPDSLTLEPDGLETVDYEVTLDASPEDSDFAVSGTITIANNHPSQDAELTGVSDVVNGTTATVDCPSLTVPAGDSLECTYSAGLPDASDRTNTATATQQTDSGPVEYTGDEDVDFSTATVNEVDECVDVNDTNPGLPVPATVCAGDAPETFPYSVTIGATGTGADFEFEECSENQHPNTASFITNDTETTGEANETVEVTVKCRIIVIKLTDPADAPFVWTFTTTYGPNFDLGHGQQNADTVLPNSDHTVCELDNSAGFTTSADVNGVAATLDNPDDPEDFGTRCVDVTVPVVEGEVTTITFLNTLFEGDARTIGYWRNWSSCTGGNQFAKAPEKGMETLDGNLPQLIGDFDVDTCQEGVQVLSRKDNSGKNKSNDAAYSLAAQLLAAKLNVSAGAGTCGEALDAIADGQQLLVDIGFTGNGDYLGPKANATLRAQALELAGILDSYNNNTLC
jgi:hypothetical protein